MDVSTSVPGTYTPQVDLDTVADSTFDMAAVLKLREDYQRDSVSDNRCL